MTGKQLKNSILQWAIQGRLVPQNPDDEPAAKLLERIRHEKERLIKEKKIKRDKNATVIYRDGNSYYEKNSATGKAVCIDDEIPFQIPEGWEWVRLVMLGITETGTTPPKSHPEYFGDFVPFLGPANILNDKITSVTQGISEKGISKCKIVPSNTIIQVCIGGSIGKCAITNVNVAFNQQINSITPIFCNVSYLYHVLRSEWFRLLIMDKATGTATPIINRSNWENLLLPLPPLPEQERIVSKIEELMPLVERYGGKFDELQKLNATISQKLRKSILQEAIQGRLVPQNPGDEPAAKLLERIRHEKERLIKEKKIKRDKNATLIYRDGNSYYEKNSATGKAVCIDDEIPFQIPEGWEWVRTKHVILPMESTKPASDFVYIDLDAVNNKLNIIDNPKDIQLECAPSRATRKLHENDLLFSMVRPYLRNIALVPKLYADAIASTGFYVITPTCGVYHKYLFYLMLSSYVVDGLNSFMKGDNSPSINNGHIEEYLLPLPPLPEQERIVSKIEEAFSRLG